LENRLRRDGEGVLAILPDDRGILIRWPTDGQGHGTEGRMQKAGCRLLGRNRVDTIEQVRLPDVPRQCNSSPWPLGNQNRVDLLA
jgi:hypothetical protein